MGDAIGSGPLDPPARVQALLAQAGWMRALAVGLLGDPGLAEDVVQEATLAALADSPRVERTGAWLAGVVRRLAFHKRREEWRRARRELAAARPEADADDLEERERLELARGLLDAVEALEPGLRAVVVQRYFEGRSSAEIARQTGVPAGTVRWRLRRALDELRARLDQRPGGRSAWSAALLVLVPALLHPAGPPSGPAPSSIPAPPVSGAALLKGSLVVIAAKILIPAAAVVLIALTYRAWNTPATGAAPATTGALASPVRPSASELGSAASASERAPAPQRAPAVASAPPVPGEAAIAAPLAASTPQPPARLLARAVDESGAPWPGARLEILETPRGETRMRTVAQTTSDAGGLWELECALPATLDLSAEVAAPRARWRRTLRLSHPQAAAQVVAAVLEAGETVHLGDLVLHPGASVLGVVTDAHQSALEGVALGIVREADLDASTAQDLERMARLGSAAFVEELATASRADGSFEIAAAPTGPVRVWAHAQGYRWTLSEPFELRPRDVREGIAVVLAESGARDRIRGRVEGPDGQPRRASIQVTVRRDGKVRASTFSETDEVGRFAFDVEDPAASYELCAHDGYRRYSPATVRDVAPGDAEVVLRFEEASECLARVLDGEGAPVENATFMTRSGAASTEGRPRSLAPGDYALPAPAGEFWVEVEARGFHSLELGPFAAATLPERIEFHLTRTPVLRGRVLAAGEPVAGARVGAFSYDEHASMTVNGLRARVSPFSDAEARTDADGRFELFPDCRGAFVVRALAGGWTDAESAPLSAAAEDLTLELTHGCVLAGEVRVAAGESPAGRVVVAHRADGRPRSTRTDDRGRYRFEGLMEGPWIVAVGDDDIDPHSTRYGSYRGDQPLAFDCQLEIGRDTRRDLDLSQP